MTVMSQKSKIPHQKGQKIMCKRNINNRRATYITEWDDGRTVLESPCIVDLVSHEILHIGNRHIVQSEYAPSELDDNIEILDKQYIQFKDGTTADVVDYDDDWSFRHKNGIAPFYIS